MAVSFVALGANLPGLYPSPLAAIAVAIEMLQTSEITLLSCSRFYRSPAWPDPSDPEFINAVISVMTDLNALALLERLHALEAEFGRERRRPNAPRPLDLDIVDHAGRVSAPGETPVLPHPRMTDRPFVLLPLAEIAPDWRHPVTGTPIADLVRALPDLHAAVPL